MPSAAVSVTLANNTEIVAAPTGGQYIRVLSYQIKSKTALDGQFRSGSTTVKQQLPGLGAVDGIVAPYCRDGYFDCAAAEALNFNASTTGTTGVNVSFVILGNA